MSAVLGIGAAVALSCIVDDLLRGLHPGALLLKGAPIEYLFLMWVCAGGVLLHAAGREPLLRARHERYVFWLSALGVGIVAWAVLDLDAAQAAKLPWQYWVFSVVPPAVFAVTAFGTRALPGAARFLVEDCDRLLRRPAAWAVMVPICLILLLGPREARSDVISDREFATWHARQQRNEALVPDDRGRVEVVLFVDYLSPTARRLASDLRAVLQALPPADRSRVHVSWHDYPQSPVCNPYTEPRAMAVQPAVTCMAAAAVRVAQVQSEDAAGAMRDWIFANQARLSAEALRFEVASGLKRNLDDVFDAVVQEIRADARLGRDLGIEFAPSVWINGISLGKSFSSAQVKWAIEFELARQAKGIRGQ